MNGNNVTLFDRRTNSNVERDGTKKLRKINTGSDIQTQQDVRKELNNLAGKGCSPLFSAKTVWPFTMFPDEVIVDREKISIVSKVFFGSERIQSILISNISDLYVDTSVFFGAIKIIDKFFVQNIVAVRYLKKDDAVKIRKIVQGLMVVQKAELDIAKINDLELISYLDEIGSAH